MLGIEPRTSRMRSERSTPELHPHWRRALLGPTNSTYFENTENNQKTFTYERSSLRQHKKIILPLKNGFETFCRFLCCYRVCMPDIM